MSPTVTVCRDCCCGSTAKHPDTDHNGQIDILRAAGVLVRVSQCLDVCEHSNVLVVHRRRRVWLGGIHDAETTKWVAQWAVSGGPIPDALRPFVIERPRKPPAGQAREEATRSGSRSWRAGGRGETPAALEHGDAQG